MSHKHHVSLRGRQIAHLCRILDWFYDCLLSKCKLSIHPPSIIPSFTPSFLEPTHLSLPFLLSSSHHVFLPSFIPSQVLVLVHQQKFIDIYRMGNWDILGLCSPGECNGEFHLATRNLSLSCTLYTFLQ